MIPSSGAIPGLMAVRVALLQCDRSHGYGSLVSGMLRQFLKPGIEADGKDGRSRLEITDYDVMNLQYPSDWSKVDAVIITGSLSSAYDQDPWIARLSEEIRSLREQKKRMLGICFGHQLICQALGGKVEKSKHGLQLGFRSFIASAKAQQALPWPQTMMQLRMAHGDVVTRMPTGAFNVGLSSECAVEGILLDDCILTLQGHPEFDTDDGIESLKRLQAEFGDKLGDRCEAVAKQRDVTNPDSEPLREALIRFLRSGYSTVPPPRQPILGFGSLLSEASARSTFPNLANFRLAKLNDFRRVMRHPAGVFFNRGIANLQSKEVSSLSVEPAPGNSFLVAAFDLPADELPAFYEREEEFFIVEAPIQELDGRQEERGLLCCAGSDDEYLARWGPEVFAERYGVHGLHTVWGWEGPILPCRVYLRHCILAATKPGDNVRQDFLDNTYLWDRKTTIGQHIAANPSIMEELPPESLRARYSG